MEPLELKLWEILRRAGRSDVLHEDDLAFAESCLDASPPAARANACEVLFRCSQSESARRRALDTVARLCATAGEEDYVVTLLIAMLYLPLNTFYDLPVLREFAAKSALSARWQIRTNAASVLQRIAKTHDRSALELLRLLATDTNKCVSENAQNAIQILGESL